MTLIERYRCYVPGRNAWAKIPCANERTAIQQAHGIAAETHASVEVHLELVPDMGLVRRFIQQLVLPNEMVLDALGRDALDRRR